MKRITALWILMIVILLALSFSATTSAQTFDSPLVTPMRPTPTGWPHAPFAWQVTREPKEKENDNEGLSPGMRYWQWLIFRE